MRAYMKIIKRLEEREFADTVSEETLADTLISVDFDCRNRIVIFLMTISFLLQFLFYQFTHRSRDCIQDVFFASLNT